MIDTSLCVGEDKMFYRHDSHLTTLRHNDLCAPCSLGSVGFPREDSGKIKKKEEKKTA